MKSRQLSRKAHWSLWVSVMLAVACACGVGIALERESAAPNVEAASSPALIPWLPSQSYPNGAYPDPRLERPVQFWRAGISLKEVFAGIGEQTGVGIRFWPPGDENERVPVNLYLNRDHPPTLRDLMAQLSWVMGCTFACEEVTGKEGPYRYYLLSTSVADSAQARLEDERAAATAALRDDRQFAAPTREEVAGRLAEYGQALRLPTEELISRYQGVDDHLLVTMLDPARRATVSFALGLGAEALQGPLDGEELTLEWQDLTAQQQDELRSCLGSPPRRGRGRGGPGGAGAPGGEEGWGDGEVTQVHVGGLSYGWVTITAELAPSEAEPRGRRGRFISSPMLNLIGRGELIPEETIALRRGLGETITDDEARALRDQWMNTRRDQTRQRREERGQQATAEAMAGELALSPATEASLSAFELPMKDDTSYALWQIQEVVASATGMHVVSDCFAQPRRDIRRAVEFLYPGEATQITGLQALRASCLTTEDVRGLVWALPGDQRAGWEWGSAGPFLRFRSRGRDLWRASMFSPATLERLDQWLDPYVETAKRARGSATEVDVTLDPEEISLLAATLSDLQVQHGGRLIGGDPTEKTAAYRQTVREDVLRATAQVADTLRALATLSDSQWQQLRGAGLRTADLTPDQRTAFGLSGQIAQGEAGGVPIGPGRGGPPASGRFGPTFGRGGPGQPGGRRPQVQGEQDMARLVMRLTEERPEGPGRGRGGAPARGPGGQGDQQAQRPDQGRGSGGRPGPSAEQSYYLVFSVDGDVRRLSPIPRVLRVRLALPTPLAQAIPLGGASEPGAAGDRR